jgi:hypothetical protein
MPITFHRSSMPLFFKPKIKVTGSSKPLVPVYEIIQCHIQDNCDLNINHGDNLKYHLYHLGSAWKKFNVKVRKWIENAFDISSVHFITGNV